MDYTADIKKLPRKFLPPDFAIINWETLEPYFQQLESRTINSVKDLEQWLNDASELEAVISEDACWRQIRMTCDTESKELEQAFAYFMMEIQPKIQPYTDRLNKKLIESPYLKDLDQRKYLTYIRVFKKFSALLKCIFLSIYFHGHFSGNYSELLLHNIQFSLDGDISFTKEINILFDIPDISKIFSLVKVL